MMIKRRSASPLMAPFVSATQMVVARRSRTTLMMLQFVAGFSALVVLSVLLIKSMAVARSVDLTFTSPNVLALFNRRISSGMPMEAIVPRDLPRIESIPGVHRAAVMWRKQAYLRSDGFSEMPIDVYLINDAFENLVGARVSRLFSPDAPRRVTGTESHNQVWAFVTRAGVARLPESIRQGAGTMSLRLERRELTVTLAGVIDDPPAGWPDGPDLRSFVRGQPAIVMGVESSGLLDSPETDDRMVLTGLSNSVWLVLHDGVDAKEVGDSVYQWHRNNYPDSTGTIGYNVLEDEIENVMVVGEPLTNSVAAVSFLLVTLSGLGFAGHTMFSVSSRRSEWALRMAIGATRGQLAAQVIIETLLVLLLAAVVSITLVGGFVPSITKGGGWWQDTRWVGWVAVVLMSVSIVLCTLAAIYPVRRVLKADCSSILKEDL